MSAPTEAEVRASVATAQTHLERAAEQVVWQIENRVWTVLGYSSWDEMREAEYGGAAVIVPRADRPELVARLSEQGLTQRQTADTIGVSVGTVNGDVFRNEHGYTKPSPSQPTGVETRPREDHSTPVPATDSGAPSPAPEAEAHDPIADAVAEFPDLAYYADLGQRDKVTSLAAALRGYEEPERSMRLDNLRKAVAADRRTANLPKGTPQHLRDQQNADRMFADLNRAAQTLSRLGGHETFRHAIPHADPLTAQTWHDQAKALADACTAIAKACRPTLRRVK